VAGLKEGKHKLETDVAELKEGQTNLEVFLLKMENRIMPIINATYENSKMSKEKIELMQVVQNEHRGKLENHELRIIRLEKAKH